MAPKGRTSPCHGVPSIPAWGRMKRQQLGAIMGPPGGTAPEERWGWLGGTDGHRWPWEGRSPPSAEIGASSMGPAMPSAVGMAFCTPPSPARIPAPAARRSIIHHLPQALLSQWGSGGGTCTPNLSAPSFSGKGKAERSPKAVLCSDKALQSLTESGWTQKEPQDWDTWPCPRQGLAPACPGASGGCWGGGAAPGDHDAPCCCQPGWWKKLSQGGLAP